MAEDRESVGSRTNRFVDGLTSRIDDGTEGTAQRAAQVIALGVRLLRWPSLIVLTLPVAFAATTLVLGLLIDGPLRPIALFAGGVELAIAAVFGWRRHRILSAVSEPAALGTELAIAGELSDRSTEARGVLESIAGGGGPRVFDRLKGLWSGARLTGTWIDQVGDLPRARYFVPPRIGTTVAMSVVVLWLVPISFVTVLLAAIAAIASSV